MFGDIYPTKYMICLEGLNFGCHKTSHFKPKLKATNIEIFMLVLDIKVDYRMKILKDVSVECIE